MLLRLCLDQKMRIFVVFQEISSSIRRGTRSGQKKLIKHSVLLLFAALSLAGCGTPTVSQQAQTAAGGIWSAEMLGGTGTASGFSFTTEFTLTTDGVLNITYFQFLTTNACFPVEGGHENGNMILNTNQSTGQTSGTFTYIVHGSGTTTSNALTLKGTVTGTAAIGSQTLSGASIQGTWSLAGSSSCNNSNGTFTMTQGSTTSTSSSGSSGS